jgi:membrane-associated protease RseP (regulator of RpoE activity)
MRTVPFQPLDPALYREVVRRALAEDLGWGDVTTEAIVPSDLRARGVILSKCSCVIAGLEVAAEAFSQLDPGCVFERKLKDGDRILIPARPNTIGVFGSVYNAATYLHQPGRRLDDYLRLAGGPTKGADDTSVFVVRANGHVISEQQDAGWFRRGTSVSQLLAEPGDTIFVPEEMDKTTFLQRAKDWKEAASLGFREARDQLVQVFMILHRLITARLSPTNLSGPLGIIGFAGAVASQGVTTLLLFLTMLSANLAVINFLPIPALDGGHMMFLIAEAIRGKPVNEALQMRLTVAGVLALLALMIFVTFNDVSFLARYFG